jgi:hypothetical protein
MPTISEFFGIVIRMYWDDHPPPHFHALYGEHEAQYNMAGTSPNRSHCTPGANPGIRYLDARSKEAKSGVMTARLSCRS